MLNRINRKVNKKGFTLIELMIVVAIIGILAAIAIPNFRNYQLKAKRGELPTNLKAIKTAEVAFQAENDYFQALVGTPAVAAAAQKRAWTGGGEDNFANIGWQPSGDVYGTYYSASTDITTGLNGLAVSDIDGDGSNATYVFRVNITDPGQDFDVSARTTGDVF